MVLGCSLLIRLSSGAVAGGRPPPTCISEHPLLSAAEQSPPWGPLPTMNGLSVTELCCLFCCPPCPGRIAAKLAFLPPEPTYSLVPEPEPRFGGAGATPVGTLRASTGIPGRWKLHLMERSDFQYSQRELDSVEVFLTKSSRGNRIACMYVRCVPGARYTVLFSHGNAVDLGQMSSFYIDLGTHINCNIFSYDYSGYGVSSGRPSEKNLYADIDAAWQALRTRYGISPDSIVLYGQSIGTVPTVDLASRYECAAVVLHSPLTSGMRVAFPGTKKTYCFDAFPNIEKVSKITSPVLIIHGTEDEVIDFSHGLALFERCPKAVEPLWVEGAGHNNIELYSRYLERLQRFISQELPSQRAQWSCCAPSQAGTDLSNKAVPAQCQPGTSPGPEGCM